MLEARVFLPKIVGAVFVGYDDDGELRVVLNRVHAISRVREVLLDICSQALQSRLPVAQSACDAMLGRRLFSSHVHKFVMFALENIALYAARLLRSMVEVEARGALDVVVAPIPEGVVRADDYRAAAAG